MFRAIIKDRKNLNGPQIADIPVLAGTIAEDKAQQATTKLTVSDMPDAVKNGDVIGVYDSRGRFYYWGTIHSKGENPNRDSTTNIRIRDIECHQFESLYNDDHLVIPQTSTNQKKYFNDLTVSDVIDLYLTSKEFGLMSIANTMNAYYTPAFASFVDPDLRDTFKGIYHEIIDDGLNQNGEAEHTPYPIEKETINLETYLYEMYDSHRRIIRPYISNPILPDAFCRLKYVESNGNGQYVNTGISPATYLNTLKIELDGEFTDPTDSRYGTNNAYISLLSSGYYNEQGGYRRNIAITTCVSGATANFRMITGNQISTSIDMGVADTDRHLFVIDQIRRGYRLNNYADASVRITTALTNPIILFGYYDSATSGAPINRFCKGRIYGCKIYNSGELLRDLIPCYRKDNLEAGFYDTVSGNFFGNSGGSTLIRSSEQTDRSINIAIFKPEGKVYYDHNQHYWDYSERTIFDTSENVFNVQITDEDVETNTLAIFNDTGTTVRAVFTVLNDGTIQQMETNTYVNNRFGTGKTTYVFDGTNKIEDLAQKNLPAAQFNHKITFDISFNGEFNFEDFNLGQRIKFYSKTRPGEGYDSVLTAWSYDINQNSETIKNASFTLGNVRNNLTSKINLNAKKKKK